MAINFKSVTLGEIAVSGTRAFSMGPFGSNIKSDNYQEAGVPVIRGTNIGKGSDLPFYGDEYVFLSEEKADQLNSSVANANDIVFVAQGSVGKVGIVPHDTPFRRFILSQNLMKVTVNPDLADPQYVYYYFRSISGQAEILAHVNQTGVPCISQPLSSLRGFKVQLPNDLRYQRRVASTLGTLDKRIELNRRMCAIVEEIARTIYTSWFVNYDPVRSKVDANSNGRDPVRAVMAAISGMSEPALDALTPAAWTNLAAAAAMFPDELVESDLGKTPAGWTVLPIGELMELAYGKPLVKENRSGGVIPVYGSGGICGYHNEALVGGPGIVVGRKGTIGTVHWVSTPFYPIDTVFYVIPLRDFPMRWGYEVLRGLNIPMLGSDSAVPGVNRNTVYKQQIVWPSGGVLELYRTIVEPMANLIMANERQSKTLATLRDTLLPKLMSGELSGSGANDA